jgi:hypothetical protein
VVLIIAHLEKMNIAAAPISLCHIRPPRSDRFKIGFHTLAADNQSDLGENEKPPRHQPRVFVSAATMGPAHVSGTGNVAERRGLFRFLGTDALGIPALPRQAARTRAGQTDADSDGPRSGQRGSTDHQTVRVSPGSVIAIGRRAFGSRVSAFAH